MFKKIYELPCLDGHKSFYGKARVISRPISQKEICAAIQKMNDSRMLPVLPAIFVPWCDEHSEYDLRKTLVFAAIDKYPLAVWLENWKLPQQKSPPSIINETGVPRLRHFLRLGELFFPVLRIPSAAVFCRDSLRGSVQMIAYCADETALLRCNIRQRKPVHKQPDDLRLPSG